MRNMILGVILCLLAFNAYSATIFGVSANSVRGIDVSTESLVIDIDGAFSYGSNVAYGDGIVYGVAGNSIRGYDISTGLLVTDISGAVSTGSSLAYGDGVIYGLY